MSACFFFIILIFMFYFLIDPLKKYRSSELKTESWLELSKIAFR